MTHIVIKDKLVEAIRSTPYCSDCDAEMERTLMRVRAPGSDQFVPVPIYPSSYRCPHCGFMAAPDEGQDYPQLREETDQ